MKSFAPFVLAHPIADLLSGFGESRKLQILIYHRVMQSADTLRHLEPTVEEFRWQMGIVANHFNVLSLHEAIALMEENRLPPRAMCISFDDGYADNHTLALPILTELDLPATIFVATGYLDGGIMFNDVVIESLREYSENRLDLSSIGLSSDYSWNSFSEKRGVVNRIVSALKYLPVQERAEKAAYIAEVTSAALPTDLMMSRAQLKSVASAGAHIGAHTVNHPILNGLDDETVQAEIVEGRNLLSEITGRPIKLFAYPNGIPLQDYSSHHPDLIAALGFEAAVTTQPGYSTRGTSRYELRRFTPWDKTPTKFFLRLLKNYITH